MLDIGIVSDEIAPDFRTAVDHGRRWGISLYELRCLTEGRVPMIATDTRREIARICAGEGVRITALSPGLFKHSIGEKQLLERALNDRLMRVIDLALELGAGMIITFGFERSGSDTPDGERLVVEALSVAAAAVRQVGLIMTVENEPGFWCDTGTNTARILRCVNDPSLKANWDPCNAFGTCETPYPDGYMAIRDLIGNVHVKDTLEGSLIRCVPVGEGVLDWPGQIAALISDTVVGHVTIETHCEPLIGQSKKNVERVRRMIGDAE
jgi:sugar phosphate isomerase/epimerase